VLREIAVRDSEEVDNIYIMGRNMIEMYLTIASLACG